MIRACLLAALCIPAGARADTLHLWGVDSPMACEIATHDAQSLTVTLPAREEGRPPEQRTLSWLEIRHVEAAAADAIAPALGAATDARLAAARLARGDAPGALRLLDPHRETYLAQEGPVSAAIAATLAGAALALQETPSALTAWLAWLHAIEGQPPTGSPPPGADAPSGLLPTLPPLFTPDHARGVLAGPPVPAPAGSRTRAVADLYFAAARAAADPAGPPLPDALRLDVLRRFPRDEGLRLVLEVVLAQAGAPEARSAARDALRDRLTRGGAGWSKVWAGLAIARSLAREGDEASARLAAVEALDIALRYGDDWPELAGLALSDAAAHARAAGDDPARRALEAELGARYPRHAAAPTATPPAKDATAP